MNKCGIQGFSVSEATRSVSSSGSSLDRRGEHVVCPKPRRLGLLSGTVHDLPPRSLRWHVSHQSEGADLLDSILAKGGNGMDPYNSCYSQVASPPPFFSGSPPSRVANPLIQDARFGDVKLPSPMSPPPSMPSSGLLLPSPPASSSARKAGGCVVRGNFGNKPAVRVEGFDCLDRDRRHCSIPALA